MDTKFDYAEEQFEERSNYVAKHMQKDILDAVSYDEWSAREYGDYKVDSYDTAFNLYDKGYRREVDTMEKLLIELENVNLNGGYEEDQLDSFYYFISKLKERVAAMKNNINESVKIRSCAVRYKIKPSADFIYGSGFNHDACYEQIKNCYGHDVHTSPEHYSMVEEGFITSTGNFVSSTDAMSIARTASQLLFEYRNTTEQQLRSYMLSGYETV